MQPLSLDLKRKEMSWCVINCVAFIENNHLHFYWIGNVNKNCFRNELDLFPFKSSQYWNLKIKPAEDKTYKRSFSLEKKNKKPFLLEKKIVWITPKRLRSTWAHKSTRARPQEDDGHPWFYLRQMTAKPVLEQTLLHSDQMISRETDLQMDKGCFVKGRTHWGWMMQGKKKQHTPPLIYV